MPAPGVGTALEPELELTSCSQRARVARSILSVAATAALTTALAAGGASCFTSSEGLEPPRQQLYFPTGIALSPGQTTLYVASSDFDLQYNGGSVAALALDDQGGSPGVRSLARQVVTALAAGEPFDSLCAAIGTEKNPEEILYPGPCTALEVEPFVRASATVGAFASSATVVARRDAPGARLFVPVRGDPSVTWFDIVDDRDPAAPSRPCGDDFCLSCAGEGEEKRCGPSHRVGEVPYDNPRGLVLPVEPIGIAADPSGESLVVAHQTTATASLIVNRWGSGAALRPTLQHVVPELPEGPTGVAAVPVPAIVAASVDESGRPTVSYAPTYLVSHSLAPELTLLRYEDDALSQPPRPFLTRAGSAGIGLGTDGSDSRGVVVDGSERAECEGDCGGDLGCYEVCLETPLRVYVANRSPASLLVGRIESEVARTDGVVTGVSDTVKMEDIVPLNFGASNVVLGHVVGPSGELERRVFVAEFDSRYVVLYNPRIRQVDGTFRTGRGPHGIAVDARVDPDTGEASSWLYVGHFTDSYLGVISLDMRNGQLFGTMVLSLGPPVPPRESQ